MMASSNLYVSRYIKLNGVDLRYLDWGSEGKPQLICLHGNAGQAHIWDEFAERLSEDYHVYALDQRGHGESSWATDGYHRNNYVSDLTAFINAMAIEKVVLVGLSMGGWNSLLYAESNPKKVNRFIMVDIAPEGSPELGEQRKNWRPAPLDFYTLMDALNWAKENDPWATEKRRQKDVANRIRQHPDGMWRWKCDPAITTYHLPDNIEPEYIQRYWTAVENVDCPFLEVRGKESITVGDETIRKMEKSNKLFSSVDVHGAGHVVTVDKPAEFIEATKEFLAI